ncbi:MAG: ABC transporter substrate-binding protein [Actinomycetota bacterium]
MKGRRLHRGVVLGSLCCIFLLVLTACSPSKKPTVARDTAPRGGVLHVVEPRGISTISSVDPPFPALDPQYEYSYDSWELLRCCLLRTLLSHSGHATEQGGADLHPDLAAQMPQVSADGLTWTFTLKPGIHYSPPLQNVEVTSADFIRAFRREARIGGHGYSFYFSVIQGFDDYAAGKSDTISGLEATNQATLLVRLTHPAGDLGYRLVLAGAAPIPPLPSDPEAPFGIATGHDKDGYGAYLVGTGPYMVEGAEKLDFSRPPAQQPKLGGLQAGRLITLVRNPSWSQTTDDLRAAYPERIEVRFPSDDREAVAKLTLTGAADVDLNYEPADAPLIALAQKVRADPSMGSIHVGSRDFVRYVSMNLAVPPFDDIHVRRALNYAVDKARIRQIRGGPLAGAIAGHTVLDSMESNLLVSYAPYKTSDDSGSLSLAKQEMAKSRYDRNHDGVCDASACQNLIGLVFQDGSTFPQVGTEIARDLAPIGVHVRVKGEDPGTVFRQLADPTTHVPLGLAVGWGKDILNASNYIVPLFLSSQIKESSGANYSLLGATPGQLHGWGYTVSSVTSIDDRISQCLGIEGTSQIQCWASLDQYITEAVVPWIPLLFEGKVMMASPRVVAFSFDQFANEPSLDRIALKPGS